MRAVKNVTIFEQFPLFLISPPDFHLRQKKEVILNKTEELKKQNQKKDSKASSFDEIQSTETKRSTPLQIQRKRVSDKTESELKLADASAEDKAQSQDTERNTPLQRTDKAEKASVK